MKQLERLVRGFRNAIEVAWEEDRFLKYPPFNKFPDDCCEHASDLLCQFLLENGFETRIVNGACKEDENWYHVWLKTKNEIVIDITNDQFGGKLASKEKVGSVHIGDEGILHKIFSVNRKLEQQTIFNDPSKYTDWGSHPNPY